MSEQVRKNLMANIKMYVGRGSIDKIHRIFVHWINRADRAEQKVAQLEKENMGQSDLIERLLNEVKSLKQQNAALEDMMDRGGE